MRPLALWALLIALPASAAAYGGNFGDHKSKKTNLGSKSGSLLVHGGQSRVSTGAGANGGTFAAGSLAAKTGATTVSGSTVQSWTGGATSVSGAQSATGSTASGSAAAVAKPQGTAAAAGSAASAGGAQMTMEQAMAAIAKTEGAAKAVCPAGQVLTSAGVCAAGTSK